MCSTVAPLSTTNVSGFFNNCYVVWLGLTDYLVALELQMRICRAKKSGFKTDVLLLLEHPPTITLGRNGKQQNLLVSTEELEARGISLHEVDRGGDITFHGPGQLVGYPLLQLNEGERDVHRLMHNLEESLIRLLAGYGIQAGRAGPLTGVWTDEGKVAAMGIHISRWLTRHGFALNVNTDLTFYNLIIPCGIVGKSVTSMCNILSRRFDLRQVGEDYAEDFMPVFHRQIKWISRESLEDRLKEHETASLV
jgi:lipoate-protein ligase B